mmetsp:Transcript_23530/g.41301  ORF Transcript_23530/g.41301 Transcript_23530/m.41301 type:complete len:205 (-) Transcript_23530:3-617(-)
MDHKSKNSHLCGTSLVQFNSTLVHFLGIRKIVPSKVKGTITEVSLELSWTVAKGVLVSSPGRGVLILVGGLHHCPCGDQLSPDHARDVVQRSESGRNVLGAGETNSSVGDEVSRNSKHGHATVLELDPAKTIKLILVGIRHQTEGIDEAEGHLGTKFLGEVGAECGAGGLGDGGGSKCSGRAGKSSEDGNLHHFGVGKSCSEEE